MVTLNPGSLRETTFRLGRAGLLEGRVTDPEGNPIANARVQVEREQSADMSDQQALRRLWRSAVSDESTVTDEDGNYTIESFPDGPRTVRVTHDGFVPAMSQNIEVEHGSRGELNVILEKGLQIAGKIVMASDSGDSVFLFCRGADSVTQHISKTSYADEDGRYSFTGLVAGKYRVMRVGRRGASSQPTEIDLQEDETDLEIRIE